MELDNVEFLPPVGREQLVQHYQQADILFLHLNDVPAFKRVLPSKIFEYAVLDKPIVAGLSGYSAQFIVDNIGHAFLFKPFDLGTTQPHFLQNLPGMLAQGGGSQAHGAGRFLELGWNAADFYLAYAGVLDFDRHLIVLDLWVGKGFRQRVDRRGHHVGFGQTPHHFGGIFLGKLSLNDVVELPFTFQTAAYSFES